MLRGPTSSRDWLKDAERPKRAGRPRESLDHRGPAAVISQSTRAPVNCPLPSRCRLLLSWPWSLVGQWQPKASTVMNIRCRIPRLTVAAANAVPALAITLFLSLSASAFPAGYVAQGDAQESKIRESVVKVSATMRYPDLTHPWTKHSPQEASGTGVVIDGKRILTNAHVVLYASQLFVESYQSSDKLPAKVESVSPGIDLAVLRLEDETFFDKRPPIARTSNLPEVKETVLVYGYPQGGSTLSIHKGIVSRLQVRGFG